VKLKSDAHYRARAQVAKAMGHPSRMLMLDALRQKELCVCELAGLVGADQSTVSRHLSILKQAGLIEDRKEGATVYHSLRIGCIEGFFQCLETVLTNTLERQQSAIH
jgi:ArsR family transcriptional regulator, arsenate/arsenite/antimonite-responsive transcriptional repressor